MYRAALYCEGCGEAIRARLNAEGQRPADTEAESTYDSDDYPKGPYPQGGGEADTPQHCDACSVFLENPLTPDGTAYVLEAVELITPEGKGESWAEFADRIEALGSTPRGNGPVVAEWIRFYLADGV
jgi:hypothetical protein